MKILMKALASGPQGYLRPGSVYEVPDALGKILVENRYAIPFDPSSDPANTNANAKKSSPNSRHTS